jgi:hypothetical protein
MMPHWLLEKTAMTSNTDDSRGRRRAGALAVVSAVAVLTAGCGAAHAGSSGGTPSTGSATYRADLAYAQCMRTHGVPNFPEPSSSESFHISGPPGGGTGPMARANDSCQHLLPPGSTTTGSGSVPQAQLDLALKVVQCMRTHGAPNFPDPTEVGGSLNFSVNLQAPQYRAPLKACRRLIPKWVRLP